LLSGGCRLIADVYAANGFLTVVPDYFQGEPMNMSLLETSEALPEMSLLGKLGGAVQLAGQIVGMVSKYKSVVSRSLRWMKSSCSLAVGCLAASRRITLVM
jgi:hypothetical protein